MRNSVEVAAAFGLIEAALWTAGPWQLACSLAALLFACAMSVAGRWPISELGISWGNLRRGWWIVPAAAGLALLMILAGYVSGTLHDPVRWHHPLVHAGLYTTWAVLQQFLLLSFFYVRLQAVFGWPALPLTAGLFSIVHLPNALLMAATFLLSLFLIAAFRKYRNILPIGLAHAVLGLALAVSMPDSLVHKMMVGRAYLLHGIS